MYGRVVDGWLKGPGREGAAARVWIGMVWYGVVVVGMHVDDVEYRCTYVRACVRAIDLARCAKSRCDVQLEEKKRSYYLLFLFFFIYIVAIVRCMMIIIILIS